MKPTYLYLVISLLVVGISIVGFLLYQERQSGLQIQLGKQGLTIQGK